VDDKQSQQPPWQVPHYVGFQLTAKRANYYAIISLVLQVFDQLPYGKTIILSDKRHRLSVLTFVSPTFVPQDRGSAPAQTDPANGDPVRRQSDSQ
jgi:hypothetical protein